jgi:hypothetical protein
MLNSRLNYFQFSLLVLLSIFLFDNSKVYAQFGSGTMKTATGYLCFYSSPNLNFTLRLDEPNTEVPYWIEDKYLQVGKDVMHIQIIDKAEIVNSNINNEKKLLSIFKKWETDYLDSATNKNIIRSKFICDSAFYELKFSNLNLKYNPWYYYVTNNKNTKFYFYFFDLYSSNNFIRFEFSGVLFGNNGLEAARQFNSNLIQCFKFYNQKLNIESLKNAVKDGKYSYVEN